MEDNSSVEHHCYYPLPSSAAKPDFNNSDGLKHETCEEEGSSHNEINQSKPGLNKYALGGAILASTTSILLGYGEFHRNSKNLMLYR